MFKLFMRGLLLSSLVFSFGCGASYQTGDVELSVPVSGTLTYQGRPIENYQVVLMPTDGRRVATGISDAQGNFVLGTNKTGDGAPPGPCKVAVQFAPADASKPGNEAIIDDPSKLPKPKIKIPAKYNNPETSGLSQDIPKSGMKDLKIELK